MSASYALMDTETDNLVGSFPSRVAALQAVAATAGRFGQHAPEVRSLLLFREDGPPNEGYVAEGEDLLRLALSLSPAATSSATASGPDARQAVKSSSVTGGHRSTTRRRMPARSRPPSSLAGTLTEVGSVVSRGEAGEVTKLGSTTANVDTHPPSDQRRTD